MSHRAHTLILIILSTLLLASTATAQIADPQADFFNSLKEACGAKFVGRAVFPEDPGDDWRDKELVAHIKGCEADELRIPLMVGEDQSRTWIITRTAGGLQLKHDHRHEDGTPDEVTMYGGTTTQPGSPLAQSFPADAYTAELIPEAATNEWFLATSPNGKVLIYYLERHGKPRFKAELRRQ